jgi:hypothetical protein
MNFTAPHAVMLGVVALGGFAVWKMLQAKGDEPSPEDAPKQITPSNLAMLGDPLHLTQNRWYRGRLRLPATGLPPFSASSSEDDLVKALTALGFANVRVWKGIQSLPSGWPQSTMSNIAAGTRFFEARWPLSTVDVPRPGHIEAMWVSMPPKVTVSGIVSPFAVG